MTPDNEVRFTLGEKESDNQEAPGMLGRGLTGIVGDGVVLPIVPGSTGFSYASTPENISTDYHQLGS